MNFGVRLPGPFRVGVSSSGRVSAGVTLGPFSASTGIGSGRRPAAGEEYFPIALDAAVAELVAMGWRQRGYDGRSAHLTQGWRAVQVEAVPARRVYDRLGRATDVPAGVTWRQVTSRRTVLLWVVLLTALVGMCWGLTQVG